MIINKKKRTCLIVDYAVPVNHRYNWKKAKKWISTCTFHGIEKSVEYFPPVCVYKQNSIEKWTKSCNLPEKGDLGITKNYRGITLTVITSNVYNILPLKCIQLGVKKILRNHLTGFLENSIDNFTDSDYAWNHGKNIWKKHLVTAQLFIDFFRAFHFTHREKLEQILLAYGLPPKKRSFIKTQKCCVAVIQINQKHNQT